MLRGFRKAFAVMVVLPGALMAPIVLSGPAQADADDCLAYLSSIPHSASAEAVAEACGYAFARGAAGRRTCVSILRAAGLPAAAQFEACRRGAPPASECPAVPEFGDEDLGQGTLLRYSNAVMISATATTCTYEVDVHRILIFSDTITYLGKALRNITRP